MKLVIACLASVALVGCTEQVKVNIQCATTDTGVNCDLTQTVGKTEVEACWDFTITCGNGAVVKAPRMCQKVKDGGTAKAAMPKDKLIGIEKCGGVNPSAVMTNLTIDGKPSQL
jgi:hypothetical protein